MSRALVRAALVTAALLATPVAGGADPSAQEIMERNFLASKIRSLRVDTTMSLVTARKETRERRTTVLMKLQPNGVDSKLLVRFHAPADIKGTAFLQIEHIDGEDDQWVYLPALKRSRRLVANNKKDSFVGSDFSYGDISLPKVDHYRHKLLRSEIVDQADCFVVESVPATDEVRTNSGYSRKVSWIRKDTFIEAKVEYYDLAARLLKVQQTADHQPVQSNPARWFPRYREMANHQTGHRTLIRVNAIESGVSAPDDQFTTRSLERE
jgi:uncharacterized protein